MGNDKVCTRYFNNFIQCGYVISLQLNSADNGKEFAYHNRVGTKLKAKFYFAKTYYSWLRGLNEHTYGLVRQYFPKTKRFSGITGEEVKEVEARLNKRPRKTLNFKTPLEVFCRLSKNAVH